MSDAGLTTEETDVFARGLYYLATIDSVDKREEELIKEFLEESGSKTTWAELGDSSFSALDAAQVLDTTFLRRIFIKSAIALVRADGVYSDAERHALGEIADAFDIPNAEFGDLEQAAIKVSLD